MSHDREQSTFETILVLLLMPFLVLFGGYLFSIVWVWFAVGPLGAPTLRVVDAIGVSCLVSWFTIGIQRTASDKPALQQLIHSTINLLIAFGVAAIVHAFQ